ncbi:MAG: hypothetical protein IPP94_18210, partial [Ignavibacteria bacterium]|nr:hypothetical protein [Ignavibacteria bacterium]
AAVISTGFSARCRPSAARCSTAWEVSTASRCSPSASTTWNSANGSRRSDIRIAFNPNLEVEHLKSYTLGGLLANDFDRSVAFVRLAGSLGQLGGSVSGGFVNIYPLFIFGTVLSWPLLFAAAAAFWLPEAVWVSLALLPRVVRPRALLLHSADSTDCSRRVLPRASCFLDHLARAVGGGGLLRTLPFPPVAADRWLISRSAFVGDGGGLVNISSAVHLGTRRCPRRYSPPVSLMFQVRIFDPLTQQGRRNGHHAEAVSAS